MFIAITSDKGNVFQHFGKAVEFTYIETEDERIISRKIITKESHNKNQNLYVVLKETLCRR